MSQRYVKYVSSSVNFYLYTVSLLKLIEDLSTRLNVGI
jgi:hypothetical protein